MIRSMTGFGRGAASNESYEICVELAAVNRKQAELVFQIPREFAEFEGSLRQMLSGEISRGRVQIHLSVRSLAGQADSSIDREAVQRMELQFQEISREVGRIVLPQAADFLRNPEIFLVEKHVTEVDHVWPLVELAAQKALQAFLMMRKSEGSHLQVDLESRLAILESLVAHARDCAELRPAAQKEALLRRLGELGLENLDLNDERLLKELAFAADRCDVTEELTRLASHFIQFRTYLGGEEASGRALDFLCQEFHRELNTIASKANDSSLAQTMVKAKSELEKIREQVQNVE